MGIPHLIAVPCVFAVGLSIASPVAARQQGTSRFYAMDRNHDGVVSRDEWQGSDESFQVHDWNRDGILSGDELRPGANRPRRQDTDSFSDWTEQGFRALDRNHDRRLSRDEWLSDRETFTRLDVNRNGSVSLTEFLAAADDDVDDSFEYLDVNRNGRVEWSEWHASHQSFAALDRNRDGVLTSEEMGGGQWQGDQRSSAAYRDGEARGRIEGLEAGREDKQYRNRWDLEGQRELEQADSGYTQQMGARSDYQAGYRAAFRAAYAEAFGPH